MHKKCSFPNVLLLNAAQEDVNGGERLMCLCSRVSQVPNPFVSLLAFSKSLFLGLVAISCLHMSSYFSSL